MMLKSWIAGGLLLGAWVASSASAGQLVVSQPQPARLAGPAVSPAAPDRPEAARPGAFCLPGGCASRPASPWNGAAFGAALIAIGWQARRRSPARP